MSHWPKIITILVFMYLFWKEAAALAQAWWRRDADAVGLTSSVLVILTMAVAVVLWS